MYLLGILALGFYALKIPERYFPGNCQQQTPTFQYSMIIFLQLFLWQLKEFFIYLLVFVQVTRFLPGVCLSYFLPQWCHLEHS